MQRSWLLLAALALPACEWRYAPQWPVAPDGGTTLDSPPTDVTDGVSWSPDGGSNWAPDAPPVQRNPNQFPPIQGALAIGNATASTLVVRVRPLLATVQLDCEQVAAAPSQWLSRNLFAPAQIWQVQSGRAFAVGVSGSKDACTALLVDGGSMPMALLFWKTGSYPVVSMPSTVDGGLADRLILVQNSSDGPHLSNHLAVHSAPPVQPAATPPGCAFGQAGDALEWTEPLPDGDGTVLDLATAPNGCHMLQWLGKTGIHTWTVCLPPGAMPFEPGDDFYASPLQGGHNLGQIQGVDLLGSAGKRLRAGRGQDVVYFGKGTAQIAPQPACGVGHDGCGSALEPLAVQVGGNGATATLVAGQTAAAGQGKLGIVRAFDVPVRNSACAGAPGMGRWVESVYTEGGEP
ncbi:MAG: hypothetical protein HY902_19785 [Deltaproteobacteria bacterium]|nr:hypothetical protein [Deltaproteobacteria bacterium]